MGYTSLLERDPRSTMFSGLTNQVSNWMGKKGEDSELPTEEKVMSPGAEGDLDLEKNTRYSTSKYQTNEKKKKNIRWLSITSCVI